MYNGIAHRRSVAVLSMLYKIRFNPVHPLNGALPGRMCQCGLPAVLWLRIGTLIIRTFIPLSVSIWNDLANPVFDGVGLAGFKSRANAF